MRMLAVLGQIVAAAVLPLLTLVAAGAGVLSTYTAMWAAMWILVVELGVIALLAVRRAHLRLWQKLLTIAALAGVGVLVVGVKVSALSSRAAASNPLLGLLFGDPTAQCRLVDLADGILRKLGYFPNGHRQLVFRQARRADASVSSSTVTGRSRRQRATKATGTSPYAGSVAPHHCGLVHAVGSGRARTRSPWGRCSRHPG